jgi:hypothetical protein
MNLPFPTLLPLVQKVYGDNVEKIKQDVLEENRDRKINSIENDSDYIPMTKEEHPDFKKSNSNITIGSNLVSVQPMSMPKSMLYYIDFKYEKDRVSKINKILSKIST